MPGTLDPSGTPEPSSPPALVRAQLPPADMDAAPVVDVHVISNKVGPYPGPVQLPAANSIGLDADGHEVSTVSDLTLAISDCDQLISFCSLALDKLDKQARFPWSKLLGAVIAVYGAGEIAKWAYHHYLLVFWTIMAIVGAIAITGWLYEKRIGEPFMDTTIRLRNTLQSQMAAYTRRRIELETKRVLLTQRQAGDPPALPPGETPPGPSPQVQ